MIQNYSQIEIFMCYVCLWVCSQMSVVDFVKISADFLFIREIFIPYLFCCSLHININLLCIYSYFLNAVLEVLNYLFDIMFVIFLHFLNP